MEISKHSVVYYCCGLERWRLSALCKGLKTNMKPNLHFTCFSVKPEKDSIVSALHGLCGWIVGKMWGPQNQRQKMLTKRAAGKETETSDRLCQK